MASGTDHGESDGSSPGSPVAWYCKRRQLLAELPPRQRSRLERVAAVRDFQARDVLFTTSATGGRVHVVLEGRVRLAHFDADGGETQLAILEPGEAFLEPPHGEVEPIELYAEGIAPGRLLGLDREAVLDLFERDPKAFSTLATPFH